MKVYDEVQFQFTSDKVLDQQKGKILGFYSDSFVIVLLDNPIEGYDPAIVISESCLKKISS